MLVVNNSSTRFESNKELSQTESYNQLDDSAFDEDGVLQPGIRKEPESPPDRDTYQPAEEAVQPMFGGTVEHQTEASYEETESSANGEGNTTREIGQTALIATDPEQISLY